ncbi:dUTP diphosphatase [Mailhella massiliensis]|uniref:dUTP diphosphatase n=1 Tax=Mailhella massiliensis TaxID=1903261 RepID=A0A921DQV8_9BACT|nr:dUTP diphosphatase [Mailhella massiliensis]HJD96366.1 dUTP diphosphatase [Mailhella massiliensis]
MAGVHVRYLRDSAALYGGGLSYATPGSAGMDLRACFEEEERVVHAGARTAVPSGICVEPCEPDTAGFIYSRSGLGAVKGLAVAQGVGVVDADYRGEIVVWLLNTSGEAVSIRRGERVAQLVFQPVCRPEPLAAEELSETERGGGGFGHTGRA